MTESLDRLEGIVARMEALGVAAPPGTGRAGVSPLGMPLHVISGETIESAWGNAVVDTLTDMQTRRGVERSVAATPLGAGVSTQIAFSTAVDPDSYVVSSTQTAVPAGLGGIYAITVQVSLAATPSAIWFPQIVAAAEPHTGAPSTIQSQTLAAAVTLLPAQAVTVSIYNGGTLVNAAVRMWMYRVSY